MKKLLLNFIAVSVLATMVACTGPKTSEESSKEPELSSPSESLPESSSSSSESSNSEESSENFDEGRTLVTDQLYTDSGLKVYFKAQGARIDKITWGSNNKQIAKDGFTVGRCANRIANGRFSINGTEYSVTKNDGQNSLHGGGRSWQGPFANATWTKVGQTPSTITYSISSADGEEGYPGKMDMTVKYTLKQSGELSIEYTAVSTKDTLCNPTNHLYMDLNGSGNYNNVSLWIDADKYTPLSNKLPTGELANVEGTKFDYRTEKAFSSSDEYDDNLVLNGEGYRKVATMKGTTLGVQVDVYTDRPGLQLYKAGQGSICLESQMLPDAINHAEFESPVLLAGFDFYSKTTYHFHSI